MALLCYGDSNTYGFDPRSFLGGRYPAQVRWTGRLAARGWQVVEAGRNGREIPRLPGQLEELLRLGRDGGLLLLMLGSNDLLSAPGITAGEVAGRMETCLTALLRLRDPASVLLIAPPSLTPGSWVLNRSVLEQSARLSSCYAALARRLGTGFADAGTWGVELLFDGVHFSPAGHRAFALGLAGVLEGLPPGMPLRQKEASP